MDAFSGYNQILMHPEDQEKTSFVTDRRIYCYKVMPFGLKNAGATYQRLVNAMFKDQLGDTMEVYIKTCWSNPKILMTMCHTYNNRSTSFEGKFMGYIVTKRGIEASPDQIKAILNIQSPRNVKEVQKLTGRVAVLNRFISKSSDKCRLFYDVLKKNKGFHWTPEHEQALQDLKQYLMTPPLLSKPIADEPLLLYVAVSESSVSAVLAREGQDGQLPVYYVSKSLVDAETRYSSLEKLVLAIVSASKQLKHYFEAHSICVKTNYPVKSILRHPELTGRMSKWAITLSSYDITYQPRTAIKSQALADFVADFSPTLEAIAQTEVIMLEVNTTNSKWILHVDGSSNFRGAGLGVLLKSPQGDIIARAISCDFKATNNEAEYETMLAGLTLAKDLKATEVEAYSDSLLIVSQIKGEFAAKDSKMTAYLDAVQSKGPKHASRRIGKHWVSHEKVRVQKHTYSPSVVASSPQSNATTADDVNDIAMDVNDIDVSNAATASTSWQTPFIQYLKDGILPEDRLQARKVRFRASLYVLLDGILFRTSIAGPYLRCLDGDECRQVLQEMHDGCCGNHSGGRSLSNITLRMGFYWPTLRQDAVEYAKKCDACQRDAAMSHKPAERLHPTITLWPFMRWRMDIVGKLPQAPGQKVFMLALTDYFSKWNEADSFTQVRDKEVITFIWRIICRFDVPSEIICDNGSQFISTPTRNFLAKWNIQLSTATPRYPQTNGQAESSNKSILKVIKRRLRAAKAVLPPEVRVPTSRYGLLTPDRNDEELSHDIVTSEELREAALVRMASQQQIVARSFNKNVKAKTFSVGDWVLREVFQNTKELNAGKLAPAWEGLYKIQKVVGNGAYRICTKDGKPVPRSWNTVHLKRYHF
ncbi:uncharacterized protein LOC130591328 [Beta vulgaris subsp. vulgaris]|uniref:uncharacterized protein LOC130591328 n=1 Tax=Beta vulgaris subsp. vulgaris TaxID=3555 RepID=UPI0025498869|nr:uncharacterized protein LOC130591328 [Beta vulgaris subsp. vulgaris]